mmetsp:Transcript_94971/g.171508  ORF Transcript_94971/g.171508 Transcript_94971/m.171508 type:complete len:372 (-) Transcript_94971:63-1178(-)
MGCCAAAPGPVQLGLQAGKAAASAAQQQLGRAVESDERRPETTKERVVGPCPCSRGSCQQLPWHDESQLASVKRSKTPSLLLRRSHCACRQVASSPSALATAAAVSPAEGEDRGFPAPPGTEAAPGSEPSSAPSASRTGPGNPQRSVRPSADNTAVGEAAARCPVPPFPGSVAAEDYGTLRATVCDGQAASIPAEPYIRELPVSARTVPQVSHSAPRQVLVSPSPAQALLNAQAQAATGSSNRLLAGGAHTEQRSMSFVMLQFRELRPEDFELLCNLDEGVPRRGTAPLDFLESLPLATAADCGMSDCRVCLASLRPDEQLRVLPCKHGFHHDCIYRWATEFRAACPLCGAAVCEAAAVAAVSAAAVRAAV